MKPIMPKTKDRLEVEKLHVLAVRMHERGDTVMWGKLLARSMLLNDLLDENDILSVSRKQFNEWAGYA